MAAPPLRSNRLPKDGRSRGKQTCRRRRICRFTPNGNRRCCPEQVKEQAISRVLKIALGTVYKWIKKVWWALKIWAWVMMQRQR